MRIWIGLCLVAVLVVAGVLAAGVVRDHGEAATDPSFVENVYAKANVVQQNEWVTTYDDGTVRPTSNRTDYDWNYVEIKSPTKNVHFNLNQPARTYDNLADDWSRVFTGNAVFRTTDYVSFCGPQSSISIQVRDRTTFNGLGTGSLTGVPPCT